MDGKAIVDFGRGWVCSNATTFVTEKDIIRTPDNKMLSKHTDTIRMQGAFNVVGEIKLDDEGVAIFKNDSTKNKKAYNVKVSAITDDFLILLIKNDNADVSDTLKKIGGYNYGK